MEIVLKFSIKPDGEGYADALTAINGHKYWDTLWEIQQAIREKVKYSKKQKTTWKEVQDMFFEILSDNRVDLEEAA